MDKEKRNVVKSVVRPSKKQKFLIVQRSVHDSKPLRWESRNPGGFPFEQISENLRFPGCGVEEDETVREAALREIQEETGLQGKIVQRGEFGKVGRQYDVLEFHVFEIEVSGSGELGDEHQDFQWVSKDEIEKLDSDGGMRKDLEAIDKWNMKSSGQ